MIYYVSIRFIDVRAFLVLPSCVIAHVASFLLASLIKDFRVHMQKPPIFERQVRHWVLSVGDSGFEVPASAVDLVEPNCELGIPDPRRAKVVKISDFDLVSEQVSNGVRGYGCAQTMPCNSTINGQSTQRWAS